MAKPKGELEQPGSLCSAADKAASSYVCTRAWGMMSLWHAVQ